MATVILGYSSSQNISMVGEIDTGIEQEDWDEMSEEEQNAEISERAHELVDLWVKDE